MDPIEKALVGIGGDGIGLVALFENPVVVVLAWVVPVAVEVGIAWWAYRAWRRYRERSARAAWDASSPPRRRPAR